MPVERIPNGAFARTASNVSPSAGPLEYTSAFPVELILTTQVPAPKLTDFPNPT